jgi:hypothetical protein
MGNENKGVSMKFFITLSLLFTCLSAFSQDDLNSMKQKANSHIDKKISTLQTARSCINDAKSKEKFKACKYDMHEDMKMQKMEMMEEKKDKMESEEE